MNNKKIKLLVVDDSVFFRKALEKITEFDDNVEIVAKAANAYEAQRKINETRPDVVTLDVEMPGLSGTEFLKKLIPVDPVPVVLVSSLNMSVFDALAAGAVDFVRKPNIQNEGDLQIFYKELISKIRIASLAKIKNLTKPGIETNELRLKKTVHNIEIIAIGASTGGTEATLDILKQLPADMPCILITQHMPPNFTRMYAERLNKLCKMQVSEAKNGDRADKGRAYIAPGDKQMTLERDSKGYYIKCIEGEKVSGHCPSVDVLFSSVAQKAGNKAIGVILTGMGRDGAEGLLKMKQVGAYTFGQDKESCVVYGMPMVAYNIGAVLEQASSLSIASKIISKLNLS